ncbi:MAG: hypothetical protein FIA94_00560 [Nitrospirae bacterium]|nr:hypothetical protein [Nitrospirota bacterium]
MNKVCYYYFLMEQRRFKRIPLILDAKIISHNGSFEGYTENASIEGFKYLIRSLLRKSTDFVTGVNNGASLYQVQHALGHRDQRMSARYAHLLPGNRDVVNCVEGKGTATILLRSGEKEKGLASANP